jgi:hypothetical protein
MLVLKNAVANSLAFGLLNASGIDQVIPVPDSKAGQWAKFGALYTGSLDLVRYVTEGRSDLLNMDYYQIVDDVFFNSVLVAVMETTKADQKLYELLNSVLGDKLGTDLTLALTNGTIITLGRTTIETIDDSVTLPDYVKLLPHITATIRQ